MKTFEHILIDIDTQHDFMDPNGALFVKEADRIVTNLVRLFSWVRSHSVPVISSVDAHVGNDPEFDVFSAHCIKGTSGQEKIPQTLLDRYRVVGSGAGPIDPETAFDDVDQIIFEKTTFNLFDNPVAEKLIDAIHAVRFVVCGVATDYCVKSAVEGLIQLNKPVWLVSDAVAAVNTTAGQSAIEGFIRHGVQIVHTSHVTSLVSKDR